MPYDGGFSGADLQRIFLWGKMFCGNDRQNDFLEKPVKQNAETAFYRRAVFVVFRIISREAVEI